jgi:hypothetical protein
MESILTLYCGIFGLTKTESESRMGLGAKLEVRSPGMCLAAVMISILRRSRRSCRCNGNLEAYLVQINKHFCQVICIWGS